jgi:hypothetical protein
MSLVVRSGQEEHPGAEAHGYVLSGKAARPGYDVRYQPDNPSVVNNPALQGVQSYVNANDFNPVKKDQAFDRHPFDASKLRFQDVKNYAYTPLDARSNDYAARLYPDPFSIMTAYPMRKMRPAPLNGTSCPYNPPAPLPMPPSGFNDVTRIVTVGLL